MLKRLSRFLPDRLVLILLATVALATLLPARGGVLDGIGALSTAAIVTLFFLHGVRISPQMVWQAFRKWRLQLAIFLFGYALMPALGFGAATLFGGVIGSGFTIGLIYLAVLPTTVQSSIAYASIARGNVAGAVIASAVSNIAGVVIAPMLVAVLASAQGVPAGVEGIGRIMLILLLPFAIGQLTRPLFAAWAERNKRIVSFLDRSTIVLAVYVAFSEAVNGGIWQRVSAAELALLLAIVSALLLIAFAAAWGVGRLLGFDAADRATMLFSGAHKSIATGAPMARILFPGAQAGAILLPLLLYHQLQLILSAVIASRLASTDRD